MARSIATRCSRTLRNLPPQPIFRSAPISRTDMPTIRRASPKRFGWLPQRDSRAARSRICRSGAKANRTISRLRQSGCAQRSRQRARYRFHSYSRRAPKILLPIVPTWPIRLRDCKHLQPPERMCVYAPGLRTEAEIGAVVRAVDRPLNVLVGLSGMTLTLDDLSRIGVRR